MSRRSARRSSSRNAGLVLVALIVVLFLVILQPFLVINPSILWTGDNVLVFARAASIIRGDELQIWTLQDLHTVPFLLHWTRLLPLGVGYPMTLALALGLVVGIRGLDRDSRVDTMVV